MFLYDTPGVLLPKLESPEVVLKLALCNIIRPHLIGDEVVADYLLYWMNKYGYNKYVRLESHVDMLYVYVHAYTYLHVRISLRMSASVV